MQQPVYPTNSSSADTRPSTTVSTTPYVQWGPVFAGAVVAAGISFVLLSFGSGIGLSLTSPAPTWRNASPALALLSGLWHLLISLTSFAIGGYIAGRMRARLTPGALDSEIEFRDGIHGATMWGLAVIFTALLALLAARTLAPAYAERESSAPAAATSGSGEPRFVAYEVDRLLRAARRPQGTDLEQVRAEAGRLLMAALDRRNFSAEDRAYLVQLVSAQTGAADAERRVDSVIDLARAKANRARRSAVLLAFSVAASLAAGLAAAWFAACLGGRHRDGDVAPSLTWPSFSGLMAGERPGSMTAGRSTSSTSSTTVRGP